MKTPLEVEVEHRLALHCEKVTVEEMERRYMALGYKLDRNLDCRCTAQYLQSGRTYPSISTNLKEADTGTNAFNYNARRDRNFELMQEMRGQIFAVTTGAILEV